MGDLGVLGEGQKVYFSEHGHVAYQISVHGGKSLGDLRWCSIEFALV